MGDSEKKVQSAVVSVVTISRTPGSLGDAVAEELAQRLGYRLVGRMELLELATSSGVADRTLERSPELRERSPSFWERFNEDRRRNASVLRLVVTQLAAQDNVVIVGLGAGLLLRGLGNVLCAQVVAPVPVRLERIMVSGHGEHPGPVSRERARELLRNADRDAAGYLRYLHNVDWLDASLWDLVINTGRFSVPAAVEILASVVESRALSMSVEDQARLANMLLATRVEAAILSSAHAWVSGLKVTVDSGRVRISGEVLSEEDQETVEQLVSEVEGVTEVECDLRIQPPPLAGI